MTVQTLTGQYLGKTWFFYVDEVQEVLRQLVKDAAMQSLFFNLWAQEHGSLGNGSNVSHSLYPFIVQNQGGLYQLCIETEYIMSNSYHHGLPTEEASRSVNILN